MAALNLPQALVRQRQQGAGLLTSGYQHCASGADAVLLFEPESRTALITFDRG